ncbi:MAG TPA: sodium:proton antiporter [Alphaproteobacteria bacterium]|jgi:CPA1 family monovalent cation:H+ antiporter|nr:sodium:proton antiporter [Alphaproteobacteria bacterium]
MTVFDIAAGLVVLATLFGYLNYLFIRLPQVIGLTIMGALTSVAIVAIDAVRPDLLLGRPVREMLGGIDFEAVLLDGMLSFLLFAGAINLDLDALLQRKLTISLLATFGVLISTGIVALGFREASVLIGDPVPLIWCLVFGALISPTDPLSVLAILKAQRAPIDIEAKVAGESLFNDGIGIVLFTVLLSIASGGEGSADYGQAVLLFAREALGGILYGAAIGWLAYRAMKAIDEHNLEVLITLSLVMGGYTLARHIEVSGPLSMAVAGLIIGTPGRRHAMSERTQTHVTAFWSVLDEVLNAVLFLLVGLEVAVLSFDRGSYLFGLASIAVVLLGRAVGTGVPLAGLALFGAYARGSFSVLVWGGLRGGLSIAMALSLPPGPVREVILTATYCVVIFSVVIQGYSIGPVARHVLGPPDAPPGNG